MEKQFLVLKIGDLGFRTKELESGRIISLKYRSTLKIAALDTLVFDVEKEWSFKNTTYASGKMISSRLLLENIDVPPLEYEKIEKNTYEFLDYTGYGFYGEDSDPVYESTEMDSKKGYDYLAKLWEEYPQCIDALVHMGNHFFSSGPLFGFRSAYNYYKGAVYIAEQNMPMVKNAKFPWILLNNRPYLRALHCLCLADWKLGNFEQAESTARKLLKLNPNDNQGVRFIVNQIHNREVYTPEEY
ncbi:MAG: hypothetical protein PHO09_07430 [Sphaerochaeta sp.]|nr:hypothetical protein [Sphaerochaeta sp.]